MSTPYHPESNGLAESAVKNVKYLLAKCKEAQEDFALALLEWRNTPRSNGVAPAVLFLGRRQKTTLVALPSATKLISDSDRKRLEEDSMKTAERSQLQHDAHAHDLPAFKLGESVLMQDNISRKWTRRATVIKSRDNGRSYELQGQNGTLYVRNRKLLRPATFDEVANMHADNAKFHGKSVRFQVDDIVCPTFSHSSSKKAVVCSIDSPWESRTQKPLSSHTRTPISILKREGSVSSRYTCPLSTGDLSASSSSSSSSSCFTYSDVVCFGRRTSGGKEVLRAEEVAREHARTPSEEQGKQSRWRLDMRQVQDSMPKTSAGPRSAT